MALGAETKANPPPPGPVDATATPRAKQVRLRVTSTPSGADVLEERDGLPRLLGVTPLTVAWNPEQEPGPKVLMLKREGYLPASARVPAPAAGPREPVTLDVSAALKPTR
jgi:hypothetical protein